MKLSTNFRYATLYGFLIGSIIGLIDIISKIVVWSFEWFEFYLSLFTSIAAVMLFFITLFVIIEIFKKVTKLKITKEKLCAFYLISSVLFFLIFYVFLFLKVNYINLFIYTGMFLIFLIAMLYGIANLFNQRSPLFQIILYFENKRIKKILENYIFMVIVFIVISFIMDIYLLNHTPSLTSDKSVQDYPNILLITIDTLRADSMSLYGYPLDTTPNLNNFAKDAVVFENAAGTASWTLASMTSIFTGKYIYNHNTTWRSQIVGKDETLLAEILRKRGYSTTGIVAECGVKARLNIAKGFSFYKDRLDFFEFQWVYNDFSIRKILNIIPGMRTFIFRSDGERTADEINKDAFKWLDKNKDQTFFLYLHYNDPHYPYTLGKEFRNNFLDEQLNLLDVWEVNLNINRLFHPLGRYKNISEYYINTGKKLYDTEIFYWDYHFNKLLNELDRLGLANETIIIITADHGEEFYEHEGFAHQFSLYEEIIHVPLIIYYPKEFKPNRFNERISTMDIFSTILDILDIEEPDNIDSVSLVPLMKGKGKIGRDYVLSELYGRFEYNETFQQAISLKNWKLIEVYPQGFINSSLFNLKSDPQEKKNLYDINIKQREILRKYLHNVTN